MTKTVLPKDCSSMAELRAQIDRLDVELVELLKERAGYIDRAIDLKIENGWPARIPERVDEVIENVGREAAERDLDPEIVKALWRQLVDWSIQREAQVIREN
ncbi:chorismate mutase family protein [Epibacterium sp. SM1969]|uniref:chorismate mutase n=1 Tax=Tritonibacter aquimaris TaxID=2663379 RepID=A0A844ALZ0_9RHOB|nr:chorismate mutase [Tritonibacter aquimaris]MQY43085.1 chorismate mutase family protein [Tritonibacter aquimaris]